MGLAEPKTSSKTQTRLWQAKRHRDELMDTCIANEPGMTWSLKLMEKMGWKSGQGLGSTDQGIQEPIQLKYNFNSKGLGFTSGHHTEQMHYSAHFERFESVLSALSANTPKDVRSATEDDKKQNSVSGMKKKPRREVNAETEGTPRIVANGVLAPKPNGGSDSMSSDSESDSDDSSSSDSDTSSSSSKSPKIDKKSIESLSRGIRGRVHYKKFTRGKDTSRYSANDMACILGSKAHELYTGNAKIMGTSDTPSLLDKTNVKGSYTNWQSGGSTLPATNKETIDKEEINTFVPSYQLKCHKNSEEVDEEVCRPGFGGADGGTNDGLDVASRPSFGFQMNSFTADDENLTSMKKSEDCIEQCFQQRFADKYKSSFVIADNGVESCYPINYSKPNKEEEVVVNGGSEMPSMNNTECAMEFDENIPDRNTNEITEPVCKKKSKKKKNKVMAKTDENNIVSGNTKELQVYVAKNDISANGEFSSKKKRKAAIETDEDTIVPELTKDMQTHQAENVSKETKKKKKKSKNSDPYVTIPAVEEVAPKVNKNKRTQDVLNDSCTIVDVVENIIYEKEVAGISVQSSAVEPPRKKCKKSKQREILIDNECVLLGGENRPQETCGGNDDVTMETGSGGQSPEKTKKKKKKKKASKVIEESVASKENVTRVEVIEVKVKKDKKKRNVMDVDENAVDITSGRKLTSNKKRKKSKKHYCRRNEAEDC